MDAHDCCVALGVSSVQRPQWQLGNSFDSRAFAVPQPVDSWYAYAMTSTFMLIAAAAIAIPMCAGNVSAEPRRGGKLLPPVSPACISSPFGPRVLPNQPEAGSYHYGIDLPAPVGTPVIASAPGTVTRLQNKGPRGLEKCLFKSEHHFSKNYKSTLGQITFSV
jgi:murein DD-endopeptidase MepM/ murein hydrolase activator NlpD